MPTQKCLKSIWTNNMSPYYLTRSGKCCHLGQEVGEDEIAEAMRMLFEDTHNVAEGAGAAAFAALMSERDTMRGRKAGVILSGGNVDRRVFAEVLAGRTPQAA